MGRRISKETRRKAAKEVGRRLNVVRKARGYTTITFAKRVGLSQAQVSRLECGLQGLRSDVIMRMAWALEISPAVFFIEGTVARLILASPFAKKIRGLEFAPKPIGRVAQKR